MTQPSRLTNTDIAAQLRLIADILQIKNENRFRVLAFKNAAESIENQAQDLYSLHEDGELTAIPNVGKGIAIDIAQLLETGQINFLEELKQEVPLGVVEMMKVPDMGPKKAARLWQELGITDIAQLKAAAEAQQLRPLKGFGAKSEEKILKGIDLLEKRKDERTPLGIARPTVLQLIRELRSALPEHAISKIEAAGSVRRWKETVGDLDILAVSSQPEAVMAAFPTLPQALELVVSGATKSRVRLSNGLECDLRVVEPQNWGAALQYFTGSKEHNVAVRELAQKQGWSLNEYGLTATGRGQEPEGTERFFETEEALYEFLGMAWIPPEMREDRGEVAAAKARQLPHLLARSRHPGRIARSQHLERRQEQHRGDGRSRT